MSQLRIALDEARTLFGLTPIILVDDPLGIGLTIVSAAHPTASGRPEMKYRNPAFMLLLVALCAPQSQATVAPPGSLITAGAQSCLFPVCPVLFSIDAFSQQGSLIRNIITIPDLASNPMSAVASDRSQTLLAVSNTLVRINSDGSQTALSAPLAERGSLSPDQNGNAFIGQAHISLIASSGQLVAAYLVSPPGALSIDLASDQCTMYYTDHIHATVYRFDVCGGTPLPALTTSLPAGDPGDVRVLPTGSLLVADGSAGVIAIDRASGAILRTYAYPARLLALSPDATSFWASQNSPPVRRIDLTTGLVLASADPPVNDISGITVIGEPRAAFAAAMVPALSDVALALLVTVMLLTGLYRLR